jgi:hypothetical protein
LSNLLAGVQRQARAAKRLTSSLQSKVHHVIRLHHPNVHLAGRHATAKAHSRMSSSARQHHAAGSMKRSAHRHHRHHILFSARLATWGSPTGGLSDQVRMALFGLIAIATLWTALMLMAQPATARTASRRRSGSYHRSRAKGAQARAGSVRFGQTGSGSHRADLPPRRW